MVQRLVTETNRYAEQCLAAAQRPLSKYSSLTQWVPVELAKMNIFIALLMTRGIVSKPETRSYWFTDPVIATPFFGTCKSRNRFGAILQFVHIVDNSDQPARDDPNRDKLFKIRPFLKDFTQLSGRTPGNFTAPLEIGLFLLHKIRVTNAASHGERSEGW